MKTVYLIRTSQSNQGTQGILVTLDNFMCKTLELPWHSNKQNISCIPEGSYDTQIRYSEKYGKVYWLTNVTDRSWILIHSGNFAGDEALGFRTHTAGCILLGMKFGFLEGQRAIFSSRIARHRFVNHMQNEPFKLNIIGGGSL